MSSTILRHIELGVAHSIVIRPSAMLVKATQASALEDFIRFMEEEEEKLHNLRVDRAFSQLDPEE